MPTKRKAAKGTSADASASPKKPKPSPKSKASKGNAKKAASLTKVIDTDNSEDEETQSAWRHVASPLPAQSKATSRSPSRSPARSRSSGDERLPQEQSGSGVSDYVASAQTAMRQLDVRKLDWKAVPLKTFMIIGVVLTILLFAANSYFSLPLGTPVSITRSNGTLVPMLSSMVNTTFVNIKSAWNVTTHTPRAFAKRLYGITKGKIAGYIEPADKYKTKRLPPSGKSKTTLSSTKTSKLKKASSGTESKKNDNDKSKAAKSKKKKEEKGSSFEWLMPSSKATDTPVKKKVVPPKKVMQPVVKKGSKNTKVSWRSMLASFNVTLPKSLSPTFNLTVPSFNLSLPTMPTMPAMPSLSTLSRATTSSKTPTGPPTAARKKEEDEIFKRKVAETKAKEAARLKAVQLAEDKKRRQKEKALKDAKALEAEKNAKEEAAKNIPAVDHSHHIEDVGGIWRGSKVLTSQRVVGNTMLSSSWYHHYDNSPLSSVIGFIRHVAPPINHLYDATGHSTRIPKDYFSFLGATGTTTVLFRHMVRISQFTLYHPSVDSEYAPKDFRVLGWSHNPVEWKHRTMQPVVIGYYRFYTKKSKGGVQKERQIFDVMRHKVQLPFRAVTLEVLSNHQTIADTSTSTTTIGGWGDSQNKTRASNSTDSDRHRIFTKIYRFQVLGKEVTDMSL